jgi:hypothetical protein
VDIYISMKKKIFPWIIALSAFSVSGSAAFYSVSGLGKMFAGASLQVMVLAGSLEFAKLVTASLLYQYWKKLNLGLKIYLSIATLILILITSAGIYGFLSSAYQETSFKVQNQDKNIEILDKDISIVQNEIKNYDRQIDQKNSRLTQLTSIRTNLQSTQDVLIEKSRSTNAVRQQIKDVDSEIKRMDLEISVLNDSISSKNSKVSSIEQDKMGISSNADIAKEVGPLKYIAKLTGSSIDSVVNWYIIILMLVFDPLAISLVIAANFAFEMSKEGEEDKKQNKKIKTMRLDFFKNLWKRIFSKKEKSIELESPVVIDTIEEKIEIKIESPVVIDHIEEKIDIKIESPAVESIEIDFKKDKEEGIKISEVSVDVTPEKENTGDKYNNTIKKEDTKALRDRFRNNPGADFTRSGFRKNPGGEINP